MHVRGHHRLLAPSSDTIATDAASGFNTTYLGSKGLLTAFIAAFVTGIIYKFFIKRNITVKMPEQVPPDISQTFKDIIPFSVCITVFWVFDIVFRAAFGFCFAQGVIQVFQPLFTAADGYIGLAVIYGAMSLSGSSASTVPRSSSPPSPPPSLPT